MKNNDRIGLITFLGVSGSIDIDLGEGADKKKETFVLEPARLNNTPVGRFHVNGEQLKLIKETSHWKKTYIQLAEEAEKGGQLPPSNVVNVGPESKNPLHLSSQQCALIRNAFIVKPELQEILVDNILDACFKVVDADKLEPKNDEDTQGKNDKAGPKKDKADTSDQEHSIKNEELPTDEEILEMKEKDIKKWLTRLESKWVGGKTKIEANRNTLMDIVTDLRTRGSQAPEKFQG